MKTFQKTQAIKEELDQQYRESISRAVNTILGNLQIKEEILTEAKAELSKHLISVIRSEVQIMRVPRTGSFEVIYSISDRDF